MIKTPSITELRATNKNLNVRQQQQAYSKSERHTDNKAWSQGQGTVGGH